MSVTELGEFDEVKGLIARGQQVGVLAPAEVAGATAELGLDDGTSNSYTACSNGVRSN
jgi:hypothetical protein